VSAPLRQRVGVNRLVPCFVMSLRSLGCNVCAFDRGQCLRRFAMIAGPNLHVTKLRLLDGRQSCSLGRLWNIIRDTQVVSLDQSHLGGKRSAMHPPWGPCIPAQARPLPTIYCSFAHAGVQTPRKSYYAHTYPNTLNRAMWSI
jgi:hypothetical protein